MQGADHLKIKSTEGENRKNIDPQSMEQVSNFFFTCYASTTILNIPSQEAVEKKVKNWNDKLEKRQRCQLGGLWTKSCVKDRVTVNDCNAQKENNVVGNCSQLKVYRITI